MSSRVDFLTRQLVGLQNQIAPAAQAPKDNMIPKGPPPKKAPAPPLPEGADEPDFVGPRPRNMDDHAQHQREMHYKAAPLNAVVRSVGPLALDPPKLPSGHDRNSYTTKAMQPPPVPLQRPQQHPPIPPPAEVPPVKPPPDFRPPVEPPPTALVKQQSYIV